MFVSMHVVVLVLAACEEDGCWLLEMVGLKKCPLHSEDRFGVHCIALMHGCCKRFSLTLCFAWRPSPACVCIAMIASMHSNSVLHWIRIARNLWVAGLLGTVNPLLIHIHTLASLLHQQSHVSLLQSWTTHFLQQTCTEQCASIAILACSFRKYIYIHAHLGRLKFTVPPPHAAPIFLISLCCLLRFLRHFSSSTSQLKMTGAAYSTDATQLNLELAEWERCKNEEQYMLAAEEDEGHAMLRHCIAKIASVCIA